jgi:hypothetical protein
VRIVRSTENRSLRPASCCSVLVMNGAYGRRRYGFSSTRVTAKLEFCRRATRPRAPGSSRCTTSLRVRPVSGSKSRPVATRLSSSVTRVAANVDGSPSAPASVTANRPSTSQYSADRNFIRARSRSTTSLVATDCTRPAESLGMTFFHSTGLTS